MEGGRGGGAGLAYKDRQLESSKKNGSERWCGSVSSVNRECSNV